MSHLVLLAAIALGPQPESSLSVSPPTPASGTWIIVWDDAIDGVLPREAAFLDSVAPTAKETRVHLTLIDQKITGHFAGPVYGTHRTATFMGEITEGPTSLMTLRQHEPGYTCAYQMRSTGKGWYTGVWHDTRGRQGDVYLRRVSPEESRPVPTTETRILRRQ